MCVAEVVPHASEYKALQSVIIAVLMWVRWQWEAMARLIGKKCAIAQMTQDGDMQNN